MKQWLANQQSNSIEQAYSNGLGFPKDKFKFFFPKKEELWFLK
jgi:hypothetical protein